MKTIEIPLSKTKITLLALGSILFIAAGFFLIVTVAKQQSGYAPLLFKGVEILAILFFGSTGFVAMKKLVSHSMGLIINEEGIYDPSSGLSIGLIKWSDIIEIETTQIQSSKFLLIYTIHPEYYIEKAKGLKQKMMKANHKRYGTPLSISSNTLKSNP